MGDAFMNPAMIIIIILVAIIVWFLSSKFYKPVGETVKDVVDTAIYEMTSEDDCVGCVHLYEYNDGSTECDINAEKFCIPFDFRYKEYNE